MGQRAPDSSPTLHQPSWAIHAMQLRVKEDLKDLPNVVVPFPYRQHCTKRVHVAEWIEGEKLASSMAPDVKVPHPLLHMLHRPPQLKFTNELFFCNSRYSPRSL